MMSSAKKAGRPKAPPRPKPISYRPKTEQERAKYLELGGSRWFRRKIEESLPARLGTFADLPDYKGERITLPVIVYPDSQFWSGDL